MMPHTVAGSSATSAPLVTVVVMAFNEVDSLRSVIRELLDTVGGPNNGGAEILIVDDGSTDGTGQVADELASQDARIRVTHHQSNLGLGEVYRCGFEQARGIFVTFFPADGQFPASIIPEFLRAADERDLVLGYLPRREDGLVARSLSWIQRALYRILVGRLPRFQGVLMVRRSVLGSLSLRPSGRAASIVFEMLLKAVARKYRVVSLPTELRPRRAGRSKVNNLRTIWANVTALVALRGRLEGEGEANLGAFPLAPFACLALAGLAALLVYQPWRPEPFDILDFSEFLTVLRGSTGFFDRFRSLATYYGTQGRVNELGYVIIAATHQLFGLRPQAWVAVRDVQAAFVVPMAYIALRAFGATRLAAGLGASVFLFGTAAASSWLRQTGEPLGTVFLMIATLLALHWERMRQHARGAVALFGVLVGMLLCKETLVAAVPFLCLVALMSGSLWECNRWTVARRLWSFTLTSLAACAVLGGLLAWSYSVRKSDAYAALYGAAAISAGDLGHRILQFTLPVSFAGSALQMVAFPPNLVFVLLLAIGAVSLAVTRRDRRRPIALVLPALVLLTAGLVVYLPWPRFEPFYATPFLFGVSLIVAALTDSVYAGPLARAAVVACWVFITGTCALNAFGLAEYTRAGRQLNHEVAQRIAAADPRDSVTIVSARLTPQAWQNPAATFGRYIRAVGVSEAPPPTRDLACDTETWRNRLQQFTGPAFVFIDACGEASVRSDTVAREYRYFDWRGVSLGRGWQRVAAIPASPLAVRPNR